MCVCFPCYQKEGEEKQFESTADLHGVFLGDKIDPGATIIFICHFSVSHPDILITHAFQLGPPLPFNGFPCGW